MEICGVGLLQDIPWHDNDPSWELQLGHGPRAQIDPGLEVSSIRANVVLRRSSKWAPKRRQDGGEERRKKSKQI